MGREPLPLSPPAIIQWIPFFLVYRHRSRAPKSGSHDRKRTFAGIAINCGRRLSAHCWFSTEVPSQTFAGHCSPQGASFWTASGRFVNRSQSRFFVFSMSDHSFTRSASKSRRSSKTSDIEAQNTRKRVFARWASLFHLIGSSQCAIPKKTTLTFWPPDRAAKAISESFGVAVRAGWRNFGASPPRVKCMVRPFYVGVFTHDEAARVR